MNGHRHHLIAIAAALVACGIATGAQAQERTAPAAAPAAAARADVSMAKYQFTPQTVRIAAGGSVRWINGDKRAHVVHFDDSGDSPDIAPGSSYERRFERAGEYPYVCGIHGSMHGVVVVE